MKVREHEIPLEEGRTIAVRYEFDHAEIDGRLACVARYDDAHGIPHLDLMDRSGSLREKLWLPRLTRSEALENGIIDFKENHRDYVRRCLEA